MVVATVVVAVATAAETAAEVMEAAAAIAAAERRHQFEGEDRKRPDRKHGQGRQDEIG